MEYKKDQLVRLISGASKPRTKSRAASSTKVRIEGSGDVRNSVFKAG
jgi:hypothetical protein